MKNIILFLCRGRQPTDTVRSFCSSIFLFVYVCPPIIHVPVRFFICAGVLLNLCRIYHCLAGAVASAEQRLHSTDMKLSHYYVCTNTYTRTHSSICVICVFRLGCCCGCLLHEYDTLAFAMHFIFNTARFLVLLLLFSVSCLFFCFFRQLLLLLLLLAIIYSTAKQYCHIFFSSYANSDRKNAQSGNPTTSARHGIHKLCNMFVAGVCVFVLYDV